VISGVIDRDGMILAGEGFALERSGPGVYTLRFLEPAPDFPVALVTPMDPERMASAAATAAGVEITLTDHTGTRTDGGFSFAVLT
jgi:hypothetical protein